MDLIIITGTPGTGKSTLARFLMRKSNCSHLDLHHYYQEISQGYDPKKECYLIDYKKLKEVVQKEIRKKKKKILIFDSHISHLLPKKMVHLCIVLQCSNLKMLKNRLQKRRYSSEKIEENLQAEIFQVCLTESLQKKMNVITFDTSKKSLAQIAKILLPKIAKITQIP